jgi:hypothetical protein
MKIPGNPDRRSMLGLDDPQPDASLPKDGQTAALDTDIPALFTPVR